MLNEALVKKYFKYFMILLVIVFLVLAFIWINLIYENHKAQNNAYRTVLEEETYERIDSKTERIVYRAQSIYDKQLEELRAQMRLRTSLLRSTLFDYFYVLEISPSDVKAKMDAYIKKFNDESGLSVYIVDRANHLEYGQKPSFEVPESTQDVEEIDRYYLYHDELSSIKLDIFVYTDYQDYVQKVMINDLKKYIEFDPNILVFDTYKNPIHANTVFLEMPKEDVTMVGDYFVVLKQDTVTGFTFGYTEPKQTIDNILRSRDNLFDNLLQLHVYELVAFLIIFVLLGLFIMSRLKRYADQRIDRINEELIKSYERQEDLYENPQLKDFAFTSSLYKIFEENKKKTKILKKENENLKRILKKKEIENLVLNRKIQVVEEDKK